MLIDKTVNMEEWRQHILYTLLPGRLIWLRSKANAGLLDVSKVVDAIGYPHEAIYKWLRAGKLSPKGAKAIVEKSRGKMALTDLYPFGLS